jgi:hypothetical protein
MSMVLSLYERPTIEPVYGYASSGSGNPASPVRLTAGIFVSLALLPLVAIQGAVTRRRMPSLPAAKPPHRGLVPGAGPSLRMLAIGDSSVSGVGVARGDETVSATTARALARMTGRPVAWRAVGLSGATASKAMDELVPGLTREPADLLIVAFGVNDAVAYRSPSSHRGTRLCRGCGSSDRRRSSPSFFPGPAAALAYDTRLALRRVAGVH